MSQNPVVNRKHSPGTYSGYNWHMENHTEPCEPCRKANAVQMDGYRKRLYLNGGLLMRPAAGTRRRLQALSRMGYNFKELGRKYGRDGTVLSNIACQRNKVNVYPETAEKITAIYDELAMLPSGDDWLHKRTATQAMNRGYLPPLAWDDEMIDDPYALPVGLSHNQAYTWFWGAASTTERIGWVLKYGLAVTRKKL